MNPKDILKELTDAAERFVNKAPRQAKLEEERELLLDAIRRAQLVLSLGRERPAKALKPTLHVVAHSQRPAKHKSRQKKRTTS